MRTCQKFFSSIPETIRFYLSGVDFSRKLCIWLQKINCFLLMFLHTEAIKIMLELKKLFFTVQESDNVNDDSRNIIDGFLK
jgi:hypothetical protein